MRIDAIEYFSAAQERLAKAKLLYEKAHYSFALYAAGVAVEALLRAYIGRVGSILEAAHDLRLLWQH
jgi:HEPN domain-containing protein